MFFELSLIMDILSILLFYFAFLYPRWRKNPYQLFVKTLFTIYLSFVAYFTLIIPFFFPIPFFNISSLETNMNFVLFYDVIHGHGDSLVQLFLNVLLFVPFGLLLPFIYKKSLLKTMAYSLILTVSIEIIQYLSVRQLSTFDVTDIAMNLLGALIGFILYRLTYKEISGLIEEFYPNRNEYRPRVSNIMKKPILMLILIQVLVKSIGIALI